MLCPSCASRSVFYDESRGEFVCTRCGLVVYDRVLEAGPPYFSRQVEGTTSIDSTSGTDLTVHDMGLGTTFGVLFEASPAQRARLRRMRKIQRRMRVQSWTERTLRDGLMEIDKLCEDLGISKGMKAEACYLYRRARAGGLLAGRQSWLVAAAVVFLGLRRRGVARAEREIIEVVERRYGGRSGKIAKNFRKTVRVIAEALGIREKRVTVRDYIAKFSSELGLPPKAVELACRAYEQVPRNLVVGKSPLVIAAAAIYLGSAEAGEKIGLREIADATGVSPTRISVVSKRFRESLEGG